MMNREVTVIKLGGSLLTDKTKPYTYRKEVLENSAREIKECMDEGLIDHLVLLHGVGSYGHPPVLKHKLHKGFQGEEQLLPLSETQEAVGEFRHIIVKQFQKAGIPVCLMYPSSMMKSDGMQISGMYLDSLKGFMSVGMVPLLGGDILIDSAMGWSIGSGDQMAVLLATELKAKHLIFISDVKGIYDTDPKVNPDAHLLEQIDLNDLDTFFESMGKSGVVDASGAMKGKLKSIEPVKSQIKNGMEVALLSLMEPGTLKGFLRRDNVPVTRIVVS
ncbi:MAG: isopentenyl phosphate kinase [Candidatus Thorarchaeota archaeon]